MVSIVVICHIALFGYYNTTSTTIGKSDDLAINSLSDSKILEELQGNDFLNANAQDFDDAYWITDNRKLPKKDSLFYLDRPAPIFRKEFKAKNKLKKATLYITSAGYYKGSINGEPIGKNILDPAWTDFSKRTYYTEYDITSQVKKGSNSLGVSLGNGFYNPLPLRKWGRRNLRKDLSVGKPTFIAKLVLQYQNGDTQSVVTDDSWKYSYGPIIKNSVYLGTVYDARKEISGWQKAGFSDSSWAPAIIGKGPGGNLQKAFF
ncbi:MAG: hypothetical protein HKM92_05180, partial [Arenibacter sp.]|nr:hypothetical protein [Arenibacter sp.]